MRNNIRRNAFGYIALTLALAMAVFSTVTLVNMNSNASAEAVKVTESATVVTSPFTEAVQKVRDSVVGVNNYTTYSYYGYGYGFGYGRGGSNEDTTREVLQGTGSGVVVATGYVLTNYLVVEDATSLEVTSGEDVFPAELAGYDEAKDIAVLYVANLALEPVTLGDSDLLQVGDWAICIGNPLSFTGTTTVGVISALNREISGSATDAYGLRTTNTMIQTDAAINSGNSGGGMFNVAGELVGIPSMKYTGSVYSGSSVEGIGMAIPINEAKELINDVLAGNGNVQKSEAESSTGSGTNSSGSIAASATPRIGVSVSNLNSSHYIVANGLVPTGVYISDVEAGSPAEEAGIEVSDIVVEVDGTIVTQYTEMTSILRAKQAGDTVTLKVYRVEGGLENVEDYTSMPAGEYLDITVTLEILDGANQ